MFSYWFLVVVGKGSVWVEVICFFVEEDREVFLRVSFV